MRSSVGAAALALLLTACKADSPEPPEVQKPDRPLTHRAPSLDDVFPAEPQKSGLGESAPTFAPTRIDDAPESDVRMRATRLVYQVHADPPRAARIASTAELAVLVSESRLRADFVAPGWPKPGSSQVRMRADDPGAYVIDARGGRPLGPRGIAAWFNGGSARRTPSVWVIDAKDDEARAPQKKLSMLCAFIASWSGREGAKTVGGACAEGVYPERFRVGMWRARLAALVEVDVAWNELRADHRKPPKVSAPTASGLWIKSAALARLRTSSNGDQRSMLRVRNVSSTAMVVTVEERAVGWVAAGAELLLELPVAGKYEVSAVQPLGLFAAAPRSAAAPGAVRLPR